MQRLGSRGSSSSARYRRLEYEPEFEIEESQSSRPEFDIKESQSSRDWNTANTEATTVFTKRNDTNTSFQVKGSRTPIGQYDLRKLRPGDQIGWHRPYVIWHFQIVVDVDIESRKLLVIHSNKTEVKKEWIDFDNQLGECVRLDYASEVLEANPPELVLERANRMIGEKEYRLLLNNCEHLATYCKTGRKESTQVRWFLGQLWNTVKTSLASSSLKVGIAEGIERVGHASDLAGAGLVVGFEVLHCTIDICRLNKNQKRGNMTKRDFKCSVTQRVSEGVVGSAFAIGGSILGGMLGTLIAPGVGTFIGSVVGGVLGSFLGKTLGSMFGTWLGKKLW